MILYIIIHTIIEVKYSKSIFDIGIIEKIEPIINPIIQLYVLRKYFDKHLFIKLNKITIPNKQPIMNGINSIYS